MARLTASLGRVLSRLRPGARSLKTTLAFYFIPVAVLPAVFISLYAIRVFEESNRESLVRRALSERDAIVAEIDGIENDLLSGARLHSKNPRVLSLTAGREALDELGPVRRGVYLRLYGPDGRFVAGRSSEQDRQIPYISKEGFRRVRAKGETIERYYAPDGTGFVTVARCLLRDRSRFYGVLEEEYRLGQRDLAEIKNRRQVDIVFLNRDLTAVAASFALSPEVVKAFSSLAIAPGGTDPVFLTLGQTRYAAFLFDLPYPSVKSKQWGYFSLFLGMDSADASISKLKTALVSVTALLIAVTAMLIFLLSNRLVKPIEALVVAMKRVKTGRVEHIPGIDTTYEIEYLIQSFNEMSRNVVAANGALEVKLEELREANLEIKNTQSTLVQSAKMISLGQIVAGVAHELNNPIAFIYSNMHHLSDYGQKIRELVDKYREVRPRMASLDSGELEELERKIEIDFLLKDMEDLTRSCVEGANRVKEIVLGLRTFSRIEESDFRLADLHEGIHNTIKLLATEFKDRVAIHEEFGSLPAVECNLSQLNQVFMNLLSNAAHAIEGRGDIWIRTSNLSSAVLGGNAIEIEIEDSGSGIPSDVIEKIFDPFFTTKRVGQGTGLGLSIAYGLIQKHHGTIEVTSELGRGTRFVIRLPVKQPAGENNA